ncbi:unnamed protein product [Meganyctiphanes norvegica]|uniref:Secreted protein n=1 Tax=Meganyctiphanes norvegica TaxID=48144 RepID=A0AAV2QLU4_MEGNR
MKFLVILVLVGLASCAPWDSDYDSFDNDHDDDYGHGGGFFRGFAPVRAKVISQPRYVQPQRVTVRYVQPQPRPQPRPIFFQHRVAAPSFGGYYGGSSDERW